VHGAGNASALVLTLINILLRGDNYEAAVLPTGLILSGIVFLGLLVTGWLGGELSYRHGVGVSKSVGASSTVKRTP
jgi:uncharacterized membrane protein